MFALQYQYYQYQYHRIIVRPKVSYLGRAGIPPGHDRADLEADKLVSCSGVEKRTPDLALPLPLPNEQGETFALILFPLSTHSPPFTFPGHSVILGGIGHTNFPLQFRAPVGPESA